MNLELDIPTMLNPFEGELPGGKDLRDDDDPNNLYRRIRDSRNDAREDERRADLDGDSSPDAIRQWRDVWNDGQEYLQGCGKDLEIVAYMIEASVRLGGIGGLVVALNLTTELVRDFWGQLLPTPDEDGIETTLLPISRLNGDVISYPLLRVPMTEDTSVGEFVIWQYTQARQLESLDAEERETRVSRGAVTVELFSRAVAESSDDFYRGLAAEIESAKSAVDELNDLFEEKVDEELAPNLSKFTNALKEAETTLRIVAGDRLAQQEEEEDLTASEGAETGKSGGGGVRGDISSREDALNLLEKVAAWFERQEPQSILPSEIRKAKRRATMTPEQLYIDLITDESARDSLFKDVGIDQRSSDDSHDG
ncbi:MAG: type VI secretion system protein TssA [Fuerstiella sp.]